MRQTFDDLTNRLLSILDLGSYKIQNYVSFGKSVWFCWIFKHILQEGWVNRYQIIILFV